MRTDEEDDYMFSGDIKAARARYREASEILLEKATAKRLNLATFGIATTLLVDQNMHDYYEKIRRYLEGERDAAKKSADMSQQQCSRRKRG